MTKHPCFFVVFSVCFFEGDTKRQGNHNYKYSSTLRETFYLNNLKRRSAIIVKNKMNV